MKEKDLQHYIERYTEGLHKHGHSAEALGWGKNGRQEVRFGVLCEAALSDVHSSVLDVGCGFADLYRFLKTNGWQGTYTGIDIVPALVEKAKELSPEADVRNQDLDENLGNYDYVVASGIFNAKFIDDNNEEHIQQMLNNMFELANKAVMVDFLSTYVDFKKEEGWHTSPEWAYALGRSMSKRLLLRSDYLPFEFALIVYKDDSVTEGQVFQQFAKTRK
jgi:SAM-dependent methyltransferase